MDITTFMIAVYCLIEDNLPPGRLRKRGPQPTLRDSEVLTIEVVGEFLDTESAEELLHGVQGFALADRNYWKPELRERLKTQGVYVLTPYKSAKGQKQPYPRFLTHMRYRIQTVFGQLVERFHAKRVWARDLWHLTSRWMRMFLSHTIAVFFCAQNNLSYLSFAKLAH